MCVSLLGKQISFFSYFHGSWRLWPHHVYCFFREKVTTPACTQKHLGFWPGVPPMTDGARLQKGHALLVALALPGDLQGGVRAPQPSDTQDPHCPHGAGSWGAQRARLGLAQWAPSACPAQPLTAQCSVTATPRLQMLPGALSLHLPQAGVA